MHAWEFVWEGPLGTVACIGVATKCVLKPNFCAAFQCFLWLLIMNVVVQLDLA